MAYKNGTEVGTGYVTIVPNAEGFGQSLSKQILGKTRDVGGRASKSFSDAFNLSTVGQAFGTVAKAGTAALGAVAAVAAGHSQGARPRPTPGGPPWRHSRPRRPYPA